MVYEPSVTFDGTTTILTYKVKADFPAASIYKARKDAAKPADAEPQSVEALILHYGAESPGLFGSAVTSVTANASYTLAKKSTDYVILPLDTALIKEHLLKKYPQLPGGSEFEPLVWIEENPAIGDVDPLKGDTNDWTNGTYQAAGFRISGLVNNTTVKIAGDIDNFDDGEKLTEGVFRFPSIATVLAVGENKDGPYTSTVNFYAGALAQGILGNLINEGGVWKAQKDVSLTTIKTWIKTNKPALRIVYQWAD
ncbi:MAG: hypothetical protein LBK05_06255 [Treponema sp.]|jgi:hypothetical protein|nr:hypothetical protein [Treponema sp.]